MRRSSLPAATAAVPARANGYVRVSTERQAGEGVSLEAQAAKVRAMAQVQDARLVRIIEDAGASG